MRLAFVCPGSFAIRRALAGLLVVTAVVAGCGHEERTGDPNLALRVDIQPDPPKVGLVAVAVGVAEADWTPRNGDRVVVTWSRDSIVLVVDTARGLGAGRYRSEGSVLPVEGTWTVDVRVEGRDGRSASVGRKVEVGMPSGDGTR